MMTRDEVKQKLKAKPRDDITEEILECWRDGGEKEHRFYIIAKFRFISEDEQLSLSELAKLLPLDRRWLCRLINTMLDTFTLTYEEIEKDATYK